MLSFVFSLVSRILRVRFALQSKKVAELHKIAKELGLTGYSHMRKQDLIYHILDAIAETGGNGQKLAAAAKAAETQDSQAKEETPKAAQKSAADEPAVAVKEEPVEEKVESTAAAPAVVETPLREISGVGEMVEDAEIGDEIKRSIWPVNILSICFPMSLGS